MIQPGWATNALTVQCIPAAGFRSRLMTDRGSGGQRSDWE